MRQLFFDDGALWGRDNLVRKYGVPKLEAMYTDGIFSTDIGTGFVFRTIDGKYRMIYCGKSVNDHRLACLMAVSEDGVHFMPEDTRDKVCVENRVADHELLKLPVEEPEVACIYEDSQAFPEERYKMLVCERCLSEMEQKHLLYTSEDLFHWEQKKDIFWGQGKAEPVAGAFYNKTEECCTILQRPDWGVRRIGYTETKDWKCYTEYAPCMQADSLDEPLAELYGLKAVAYHGMYIGFPYLYSGHKSEYNGKFYGGTIEAQLAYSFDGRYWQRSLREPFLGPKTALEKTGREYPLMWLSSVWECDDGDILIYASASERVHGEAFGNPGTGKIHIYSLRKDGFIFLETEDKDIESSICTREMIWQGGEMCVNIQAVSATIAVRVTCEKTPDDTNFMGFSEEIEGYSHEDCIPFSGDSKDWMPVFKSGKKLDDLKGKTIVIEVKFSDGRLYSLEGDFTNIGNIQASRYRKMQKMPEIPW